MVSVVSLVFRYQDWFEEDVASVGNLEREVPMVTSDALAGVDTGRAGGAARRRSQEFPHPPGPVMACCSLRRIYANAASSSGSKPAFESRFMTPFFP